MAEACDSFPEEVEEGRSVSDTQKAQGLPRLLRKGRGGTWECVPYSASYSEGNQGRGSREPRLRGPAWAIYQDSVSKGIPTNEKERKYFLSSVMGKRTWIY